jgi:hypothetical protein
MLRSASASPRHVVALSFALALVSGALPAAAQAPELHGSWVFMPAASDSVEAAIVAGTEGANRLVGGMMRSRLRRALVPPSSIHIAFAGEEVTITEAGANARRTMLDGSPTRWRSPEGESLEVRSVGEGAHLKQSFSGQGAAREHVYRLRPDGNTLELAVTIRASRLPRPIEYTLVYTRDGS